MPATIKQPLPQRVMEHYGPLKSAGRTFDRRYWQAQGDAAIFEAAEGLIMDYLALKHGHVDEPKLDRTVESIRRA